MLNKFHQYINLYEMKQYLCAPFQLLSVSVADSLGEGVAAEYSNEWFLVFLMFFNTHDYSNLGYRSISSYSWE